MNRANRTETEAETEEAQMSCCQFSNCDLLEPKEPFSSFVASYQPHSAVPVVFQNHKDSVMRASGILQVLTMRSRDILQQAKGDHLDRVHSDQMVLEITRRGRLVQYSHSSEEVSKLG